MRIIINIVLSLIFFFSSYVMVIAQGSSVNETGAPADSSAILDVSSTNKGLLIPRLTTIQREAIDDPANGLLIFNINDQRIEIYNDSTSQWNYLITNDVADTLFTCGNNLTDSRDGQIYTTVEIGSLCWMAQNLNIGTIINGNINMTDDGVIEKYCYDNSNCATYGGLYQWDEMMQYTTVEGTQGICPDGWHIPSDEEWKILEGSVDSQYGIGNSEWNGTSMRGYDAGLNLKVASGWISEGDGRNLFGFEAFLSGYRKNIGVFEQFGIFCNFWTSTESSGSLAWRRNLAHNDNGVDRFDRDKIYGFSVRCILN